MNKIKYITFILCLLSTMTFASDNKENQGITFFESNTTPQKLDGDEPNDPDPGEDPETVPVNNYLPLLVIAAGLVALRFRKKIQKR